MDKRWESAWQRGWQDAARFRESGRFFWICEVIGAAVVGFVVAFLVMPREPSRFEIAFYPSAGAVLGLAGAYVLILAYYCMVAPNKQRDEVRKEAVGLQATLIEIEQRQACPPLISVVAAQGNGIRPMGQGNTASEVMAYLDVSPTDTSKPLRNCRVKLVDIYHFSAYTDRGRDEVVESWVKDAFYSGQTYLFCWSGRPSGLDVVDIYSRERVCIAKSVDTACELTTTSEKAGHLFHGDQYRLVVEITADNSLPLTKEYRLQMQQGDGPVIEEWDASRTSSR